MAKEAIPPRTSPYLRAMSAADQTKLALIEQKVDYIVQGVDDLKGTVTENYATKASVELIGSRLAPLEKIVYGICGLIGIAVIGAVMGLVLIHH